MSGPSGALSLPPFGRNFFGGAESLTRIGLGAAPGRGGRAFRAWDHIPEEGQLMMPPGGPVDTILYALQERAKELTCLYRVNEICNRPQSSVDE
ncbi:MAG: hypothetical protein ACM3JH_11075, partial [Acidithiobacillales bacterium]